MYKEFLLVIIMLLLTSLFLCCYDILFINLLDDSLF